MDKQVTCFREELEELKHLNADHLYNHFHEIQFQTLSPQWSKHLKSLVKNDSNILEICAPRLPEVPKDFSEIVQNQIAQATDAETLFFNFSLSMIKDPYNMLDLALQTGLINIIIHDNPKDGTFQYESYPEVAFFNERNQKQQSSPNRVFDEAIRWSSNKGWRLCSDNRLDFVYSDNNKMALCKMELALDLIYSKFDDRPSTFNNLLPELENWYLHPQAKVVVKGCSRWLVLTKSL